MPTRDLAMKQLRRLGRRALERFSGPQPFEPVDDRPWRDPPPPVRMDWPEAVAKPRVGLVRDHDRPPYWTKFQRFLETNDIPFDHYDPWASGWLAAAAPFDVIVWRVESPPSRVADARRKLQLLEGHANKVCYPSTSAVRIYEDKIVQWELLNALGFPAIETFYSASYTETLRFLQRAQYPLVSKVTTGSGSRGVTKVPDLTAGMALAKRAFSINGMPGYWPYERQHGYVLLQTLVPNDGYDLRIIVIGARTFGYYRDTPPGDFRASGRVASRKADIPKDAMDIARAVAHALDHEFLAVDFLRRLDGTLAIIEMSTFTRVDTPKQLAIDGVPGAYVVDDLGEHRFVPGAFWPQELTLEEFFRRRWIRGRSDSGATLTVQPRSQ